MEAELRLRSPCLQGSCYFGIARAASPQMWLFCPQVYLTFSACHRPLNSWILPCPPPRDRLSHWINMFVMVLFLFYLLSSVLEQWQFNHSRYNKPTQSNTTAQLRYVCKTTCPWVWIDQGPLTPVQTTWIWPGALYPDISFRSFMGKAHQNKCDYISSRK